MTTQEFSIEFDILYNNLASNAAPPLNEYEKSVFLTKAQSDIVLELYSGRNNLGLAFESSEEVRRYLYPLIKQKYIPVGGQNTNGTDSYDIALTDDLWVIVKEHLKHKDGITPIIPITQDEYYRLKGNPFKGPKMYKRALRLESDTWISIIADKPLGDDTTQYVVTYLMKPAPIILDDIQDTSLTIEGVAVSYHPIDDETKQEDPTSIKTNPQDCILDSSIHRMILDRAVLYAKQAYVGGQAQRAQQE
jgi:hypothetical protein